MEDYTLTIAINATVTKVFNALTQEIMLWWTEMFEGAASATNDEFTVRFGNNVYKTIDVLALVPGISLVWYVKKSLIAIPELKNQSEWVGTTIIWTLQQKDQATLLQLEHKGLNASVECYQMCTAGWQQFVQSLKVYVETGVGMPFKKNVLKAP